MAGKEHKDNGELAGMDTLDKQYHPIGTGVGGAGGAVAGATIGSVGGPVGAVVGGVIGAVAGAVAGKGLAQAVNPAEEDAYWREAHTREPYYKAERSYDDYAPAYRMGWSSRAKYDDGTFEQYEPSFRNDWDMMRGNSRLEWDEARHAVRAGWHRVERRLPGDADGDNR